jgi:DNA-binding NarL/FixJ family response regulator
MMDAARREEILRAYLVHARRFDEIASRTHQSAGLFSGAVTAPTPQNDAESAPWQATVSLSKRQQEVLSSIADGLSNAEIGSVLHISEETVKTHVRRILRSLGAHNRTHAVRLGYACGLLV